MPHIDRHVETSKGITGKEYREVHEWLDGDPEHKAARHDLTKMYEHGREIEEKYGREAREEYVRHLHDDVKAKFDHLKHDFETALADTLSYFGIK